MCFVFDSICLRFVNFIGSWKIFILVRVKKMLENLIVSWDFELLFKLFIKLKESFFVFVLYICLII